jgi:hypothetical protein
MPVVHVRPMAMRVGHGQMAVGMGVRLNCWLTLGVCMLVMRIMHVAVLMFQFIVSMFMDMPL